jgi:hypothetical protein
VSRSFAVQVEGIAFWSSRLPSWDIAQAVIRGEATAPAAGARPVPALLAPTERRRAPDTVAVALEVAAKACEAAGRAPADLPSVFASTHGDIAISDYMCTTLATTPTLISPIKFHNSVHNAAAGYWSIGTGSKAPYTAISAFEHTFGAGLLEAATQVACEEKPVLFVAFDIEAKGALGTVTPSRGMVGAAVVLGPSSARGVRLMLQVQTGAAIAITPASSPAAEYIAPNALAPCLPFFELLARQDAAAIRLALGTRMTLCVQRM